MFHFIVDFICDIIFGFIFDSIFDFIFDSIFDFNFDFTFYFYLISMLISCLISFFIARSFYFHILPTFGGHIFLVYIYICTSLRHCVNASMRHYINTSLSDGFFRAGPGYRSHQRGFVEVCWVR